MAPHRPASAPAPDATPKAKASGKEIMAVVTPPKISPLKANVVKAIEYHRYSLL